MGSYYNYMLEESKKENMKNDIQAMVRVIPDHPRPGVMYQDMASIFNHPEGLQKVIELFQQQDIEYDRIVGLDARGFPMAGAGLSCVFNSK
jgi:adenine phosphoribosyltransferase